MPVVAFSLIEVFIIRAYAMAFTHGQAHAKIQIKENLWQQLKDWMIQSLSVINPLTYPANMPTYDYALPVWTLRKLSLRIVGHTSNFIAKEIYGSFACYLILIAMANVSRWKARLLVFGLLLGLSYYVDSWFMFLFFYGVAFADYDLELTSELAEHHEVNAKHLGRTSLILFSTLLVVGLYIAGLPGSIFPFYLRGPERGPSTWLLVLGCCLVFTSVYQLRRLRSILESTPLQYLGKISFGLYIVHWSVLEHIAWPYTRSRVLAICGSWRVLALLLSFCWETSVSLLFAHWFEKFLDAPSVKISKFVERSITNTENTNYKACENLPR